MTVQSLFTAEEWSSATTDKIANVPSDVILGSSNPAQAALSIGSQWAGKLTLNVAEQIQGAGGKPGVNEGRGGDALAINATGTSGQGLIVTGSSRILAGGGNYVYRIGELKENGVTSNWYSYYRELVTKAATTGGAGGSGGAGQGYNQSPSTGANGAAGGTNAGAGGKGGNGGAFGQAGAAGGTGANGTSTSGTAGMAGGAAGTAIVNTAGAQIIYIN